MLKEFLEGKPLRHPLHPMIVHLPIGLFMLSLLLDLATFVVRSGNTLSRSSFFCIATGVATALVAAVPGFVDYTTIRRDHPAKKIAIAHMLLNLSVVALYALNLGIRYPTLGQPTVPKSALVVSAIAIGLLSISGYLGGKMVYAEGIAVGRHRRKTCTPEETIRVTSKDAQPDESGKRFVAVAEQSRLAENETLRVQLDATIMTVAKVNGEFYAFQEFCTHRFGPLSEGSFHDGQVQCPWHRSCFNVKTGEVTHGPAKLALKTFATRLRDGKVWVMVPD
jgi:nitrite reductase/ring-hydroxylating ferredoxin subunit/uncharacterized membrane protein